MVHWHEGCRKENRNRADVMCQVYCRIDTLDSLEDAGHRWVYVSSAYTPSTNGRCLRQLLPAVVAKNGVVRCILRTNQIGCTMSHT